MTRLWNSVLLLLLVNGLLLGLTLPLAKLARQAGVEPALWAFVISFGAGAVLFVALAVRGGKLPLAGRYLRYFAVAALVSYVVPNLLLFSAIPHLGAGYTGIMFTLSPLITLVLSALFGIRQPTPLGVFGIGVGFVGALTVAWTRGVAGQPAEPLWVILGLLIPVSLAAGNVYRSYDWPSDANPIALAAGSHLAAAGMLFLAMLVPGVGGDVANLDAAPWLAVIQVAASATMFVFFFRLQAVGGPVYLSQIGYVGAAVGLFAGLAFLGERYGPLTWIGAAIIAIGVTMTTWAQRMPRPGTP